MYLLKGPNGKVGCFILPPKTGTRSQAYCIRKLDAEVVRGRHGIDEARLGEADLIYAAIRNPYDLLVSWFHYSREGQTKGRQFEEWFEHDVTNKHNSYLAKGTCLQFAEHADRYIRYEKGLQEQLREAVESLGFNPDQVNIPHLGQAKSRKPWEHYYPPHMRRKVRDIFHEDFKRYGYDI